MAFQDGAWRRSGGPNSELADIVLLNLLVKRNAFQARSPLVGISLRKIKQSLHRLSPSTDYV